MTFSLKLEVTDTLNTSEVQTIDLVDIERSELKPETLGLMLEESKTLLEQLQQVIIEQQIDSYLQEARACADCGNKRKLKDNGSAMFNTLFGKLEVNSPRWHHCSCEKTTTKTFRPLAQLLPERRTPELLYLESKWGSLISYGMTAKLLKDVLPLDDKLSGVAIRNTVHKVAAKADINLGEEKVFFMEGCQRDWANLPIPDGPLTVGLDGGFLRSTQKGKFFEVIAGKSMLSFKRDASSSLLQSVESNEPESSKCFGFIHTYDDKAKRRLYETLKAQGMQDNQQITFLSDGGESLRGLQKYLNPEAEHVLDWFHITMRMTVLKQTAKGLPSLVEDDYEGCESKEDIQAKIESIKHYLWHGNAYKALQMIQGLEYTLYDLVETLKKPAKSVKNLYKYVGELYTYIRNNTHYIRNYGERYRNGERISTGFVESTINQVVSKRFSKKQQMRWTKRGAHLLLQTRTRVLNDELADTFKEWYPHFRIVDAELPMAA